MWRITDKFATGIFLQPDSNELFARHQPFLWLKVSSEEKKTERRRKSDFASIRRMIDKSSENTCVNNLNIISNEDNKDEVTNNKSNVLSSVNVLLNGLNLVQLKQLQNYVNKKLSISKLNIYNEWRYIIINIIIRYIFFI